MKYKFLTAIVLLSLLRTSVFADDWDFLSVHGYGSLGGAYQDDDQVLYRNSLNTVKGSRGDFSLSNYSNLGLQIDATLTDKLTLTVQGTVSENNSEGELLELGWANINYQVNDDLSIKVGKMRIPAFMYSDILNVAYAYDWVKLPEMYSIIPFHNYKGVELNYNMDFDDLVISSTLMYGQSKSTVVTRENQESELDVNVMKAVELKLVYDNLTLHFNYTQNHLEIKDNTLDTVTAQLSALGIPTISQAVQKYTPKEILYWNLGGRYDFENAYVLGEYMEISSHSFLADHESWYVGSGYNFERWSPFILYSKTSSSSSYQNIAVNGTMSPQIIGAITVANQALDGISKISCIQSEIKSVGFRYNLYDNAVIKFQYDHHKESKDDGLSFNFNQDEDVDLHVFSTAINFVF